MRIADQRAAQRQQVVQVVGGILGHAQRAELREVEVHFGRRLGARRHLELDLDPVDGVGFTGARNVDGRHDQRHLALRRHLAQAATDMSFRAARQQGAVHVGGATRHRGPGIDVLLHDVLGEPFRCQHRHLAGVDVGLRGHAQHAAEMVDVAMGVDHRDDGPLAPVGAVQLQRRGRHLGGDQRVDHDQPGVALDEADVGEVQAADLIDARHHFVEALFGGQLALCRHRLGCTDGGASPDEERVGVVVPHHASVGGLDDARRQRADEPPVGVVEIGGVVKRQRVHRLIFSALLSRDRPIEKPVGKRRVKRASCPLNRQLEFCPKCYPRFQQSCILPKRHVIADVPQEQQRRTG